MTCGTGGWTGPKPGDPDNNIVLTAQTVFGGIEVEWTYPSTNPEAVAFVILHRGTTPNYYQSIQHKIVSGNSYYDKIKVTQPVQYFYWIRVVSVNSTIAEPIGPASAFATPNVGELIEFLTGQIDSGLLAQSLKDPIDRIPVIEANLAAEAQARIANSSNLTALISSIEAEYGDVRTLLLNEVQNRQTAVSSVINSIDLMYADFGDQTAAILTEQTVQATDIASLASRVVTLEANTAGDVAILLSNYETAVDAQAARAALSNTLTTNYQNYVSTLLQDYETISSATAARGTLRTQIQSDYEGHVANVLLNYQTIAAAEYAEGQLIQQLQNSFNGYVSNALTNYYTKSEADYAIGQVTTGAQAYTDTHLAAVEQTLTGWINDTNDDVRQLGALYTVRVTIDGLVGGFGIFNDGTTIEAGFDVDTFWVGKTNLNRRKPFMIYNGTVYMDSAVIRAGTIESAHIQDAAITNAKIGNLAVDSAKLANLSVTNAKIGNLAVNTFKLAGESVMVNRYVQSANADWTFNELNGWDTLMSRGITINGLDNDETASIVVMVVTQLSPFVGDSATLLGRILVDNNIIGDGAISVGAYGLQFTVLGYTTIGPGTHTVTYQMTANNNGTQTLHYKRVAYFTKAVIMSAKK